MFSFKSRKNEKGFSLIEVLVVIAISVIIFAGLFASFEYSLKLIAQSRAKMTALTVANDQMEYIRSLSYDSVGTVSGIPPGSLVQVSTTTLNGINFTKRILVDYVDDDADGIGASDSNGITTDYKQAKVAVSWNINGVPNEVFLVSNIIPRSIETSVGGGTLKVNVFDAAVQSLSGIPVRVVNNTVSPNIDVTRSTDSTGVALFGGAPAGPDYEIFVGGGVYSSEQTYKATTTLPSPSTQPVAVLEADISTMNFFVDRTSELTVRTFGGKSSQESPEPFDDMTGVATSTNIEFTSGSAVLSSISSVYSGAGNFFLTPVTPVLLESWEYVVVTGVLPSNTSARVRLYTSTTSASVVPDAVLPGNAAGFTFGTIDISALPVATYPTLVVGVDIDTSDTNVTPSIDSIKMYHLESTSLLGGVDLDVRGTKIIGTNASGTPVYKKEISFTTNGSGEYTFSDLEWDAYTFTAPSSYDIAEACGGNPLNLSPNTTEVLDIVLVANTTNTLRVTVEDSYGTKIIGAEVELSRPSFSETLNTSTCGQTFFSGLSSNNDYQLTVTPDSYPSQTVSAIDVTLDKVIVVKF